MNGQAHNGDLGLEEIPKTIDLDSKAEFRISLPDGSESVAAELKSLLEGTTVECKVSEEGEGRYLLSVVPTSRGRHKLTITSNGVMIKGAPVGILVCCPPQLLGKPVKVIEGINRPGGVALRGDNELVVTETEPAAVTVRDREGRVIKSFDEGSPQLDSPYGVTVDSEGSVYVTELVDCRIYKFSSDGHIIKTICITERCGGGGCGGGGAGVSDNEPQQKAFPASIKANHKDQIYVCDDTNKKIHVFDKNLEKLYSFGESGDAPGNLQGPSDISFDSVGNVYVADTARKQIVKFSPDGMFLCEFETKSQSSELELGICVCPSGLLFVSDFWNSRVMVFDRVGGFLTSFGKKGVKLGELDTPAGIAVNRDGFVYVCDQGNSRILVF